ncbi:MAG: energy-coupling factor transporter ATPase [Candidatus Caldatribacteriota bacterium]|jgi:energy-coupling factor transport system ATP-binding protein|nr:energy-coupling factor transporter ATPase [Atribacterota bacterium]MDD3030901.1 energy-coupling factor transporter ATPase [Atribacterota bacterium]MDD3640691.1 energy-coupling factor transporter ATPase [Atribacterota bacterium]MDD4288473.1 energy-coupling factor transporter ATPase [Atribacterota bacterium]MDD4764306.1 energy-coupling factor transporter ATPase [Atribacterota bacterium]
MLINLKNVSYTYNLNMPFETDALKSINLKIKRGEFVGIIGHTGCGKTTLLQMFNGLLEPTEGKVFIDGVDIHQNKAKLKEIRKIVGLTFQYPENQLFEETVFKEIAFGPKNTGIKDINQLERRVRKAMKMVEMDYSMYKDKSPFSLSGGEMRRVAIASILAIEPDVIILDEPTASLDPQNRKKLLKLIKDLHISFQKTIILVSHNMEVVAELSQRIIVMENGRIVMDDTPKAIFRDNVERLETIGLSLPQITYIMHKLKTMGRPVDSGVLTLEEAESEIINLINKRR